MCSPPWLGRARSTCTSTTASGARSSLRGMGEAPDGGAETSGWWAQALLVPEPLFHFVVPSSALYASRLYLGQYQLTHPERLAKHTPGGPWIRGTTSPPCPPQFLTAAPMPAPFALRAVT